MTTMDDTQTIDADALRARLAEMAQRARDEMGPAGLRERIAAALRARHGDGVTVEFVVRGDAARVRYNVPGLHCYSSVLCHDENDGGALGALAYACGLNVDGTDPREQGEALARRLHAERESVVAELDRARDETDALRALLEVAQTSLAAATSGRRVTACDEIERLQRERDALRDAAREMLAAIEAPAPVWDADESEHDAHAARLTAATAALRALVGDTTMRRDLPAVAVVSCPACGYGCTADLIDGAYVLRPHSRRETARVGLGGIVWCDGGTVRAR